jgi:DNA repair exonuclease SbcCD ATPase subunit
MRYVLSRIAEALGCSPDEDEDLVEAATRLVAEVERLRGDLARCREAQRATAEGWRHEVAEVASIIGAPAHTAELAACVRAEVERLGRERDEARAQVERLRSERDEAREHTSTAAFMRIERERDEARHRARRACQVLIAEVGAHGPADVDSVAERSAAEIQNLRDEIEGLRAEVERLRDEHKGLVEELTRAINGMETALSFEQQDRLRYQAELAALRDEIGEAWFADECDTITALRRKVAMLQRLADDAGSGDQ